MMQPRSEDPTHEQIETRAYELYLQRGGEDGPALEDWLTAEDRLRRKRQEFERLLQAATTFKQPAYSGGPQQSAFPRRLYRWPGQLFNHGG